MHLLELLEHVAAQFHLFVFLGFDCFAYHFFVLLILCLNLLICVLNCFLESLDLLLQSFVITFLVINLLSELIYVSLSLGK